MTKKRDEQQLANECLSYLAQSLTDFTSHQAQLELALDRAVKAHHGQLRKYELIPYLTHPIAIAQRLADDYDDPELVMAAILHDVVEDSDDYEHEDIYQQFGEDVGLMVDAVSKKPLYLHSNPSHECSDKVEKLLAGGMKDVRVLLLKLADRKHNLSTLVGLKPAKQIRMTFETQAIYDPLRTILEIDEPWCTCACAQKRLQAYLSQHTITDEKQLKENLFSSMYDSFDSEMFDLAYGNTDAIVWAIEDKERYEKLLENPDFEKNSEVISMETDGESFKVRFYFTQWHHLSDAKGKNLKIFNFRRG